MKKGVKHISMLVTCKYVMCHNTCKYMFYHMFELENSFEAILFQLLAFKVAIIRFIFLSQHFFSR